MKSQLENSLLFVLLPLVCFTASRRGDRGPSHRLDHDPPVSPALQGEPLRVQGPSRIVPQSGQDVPRQLLDLLAHRAHCLDRELFLPQHPVSLSLQPRDLILEPCDGIEFALAAVLRGQFVLPPPADVPQERHLFGGEAVAVEDFQELLHGHVDDLQSGKRDAHGTGSHLIATHLPLLQLRPFVVAERLLFDVFGAKFSYRRLVEESRRGVAVVMPHTLTQIHRRPRCSVIKHAFGGERIQLAAVACSPALTVLRV